MPRSPLVPLLAVLLLAGCTTITPEERRALDAQTCRGYGFQERSEAFADCLMRLDLDRRAELRERLNRPPPMMFPPRVVVVERYGRPQRPDRPERPGRRPRE